MPIAEAMARTGGLPLPTVQIAPADPAFLQYTGGTTGLSKGAVLTHRSVGAGVLQSLSWMRHAVDTREWSVVAPLPLYHVYPLQVSLITFQLGGVMRLVANPRDPGAVIAEMKRAPFLVFIGVNTLFNALVNAPELATRRLQRHRAGHRRRRLDPAGGVAALAGGRRPADHRGLRAHRDIAFGDLQPAGAQLARSASRCRRPMPASSMTTAGRCPTARRASCC